MLFEAALGGKYTLALDENLLVLKNALRDLGFKVMVFKAGTQDEDLWLLMQGMGVVTANSKDFRTEAMVYDFDVISLDHVKFIDDKQDRTNQTANRIARAIRETKLPTLRGHFLLSLGASDGFKIEQLF